MLSVTLPFSKPHYPGSFITRFRVYNGDRHSYVFVSYVTMTT